MGGRFTGVGFDFVVFRGSVGGGGWEFLCRICKMGDTMGLR